MEFEKVISFEPDVRNMTCLKSNTKKRDNIEYRSEGVGETSGYSVIKQSVKNCGNSYVLPPSDINLENDSITVKNKHGDWCEVEASILKVVSIDSLELENVDLIKIDTQGTEFHIIKGAIKTIKKYKPWICFELGREDGTKHTKNGYTDNDILKYLKKLGYTIEHKSRTDCIMNPNI